MEKYGKDFKELSRNEKIWYLWEYYRRPALAIVIAVILVGGLLVNMLKPREVNEVDITIAGGLITNDDLDNEMTRYKEEFNTGLFVTAIDWNMMSELVMVMQQKIMVMMQSKELDILVLPTDTFKQNLANSAGSMFIPLDEIPELAEIIKSHEVIRTGDVTAVDRNGEEREMEEHIWGIKVPKLAHLAGIDEHEEMVIGITATAKDVTKAANMVDYLVD
ncbi:hypothetical protein CS063_05990 [Sporanaerobium hydrogeniformans]|uniref:Uncharacterized protein n=1 Tax=Sporanaerobium hydrogeniformans TaxID=3072179 RepID=A0AC61DEC6_9FIRM|nr:hypothetical protein [Sporanaerobium hydrogeniformans]PHV71240.1 hypothetical protein CS063_05990 [Sporanaerobium hydrogeniformans]